MSLAAAPIVAVRPDFLTRVTPAARLAAGMTWLIAAVVTLDPVVPIRLTIAAAVALVMWSGLPLRRVPGRMAPLGLAMRRYFYTFDIGIKFHLNIRSSV